MSLRLFVVPLFAGALLAQGCSKSDLIEQTGGDPDRGRKLLAQHQCGTCHVLPDLPSARGRMGPSLVDISQRQKLRGDLPNTPANLIRWIFEPGSIKQTTMPKLVRTEQDAKDLAAALYDAEGLF